MKTLVIGDLHGQHELVDLALKDGFPVVFLGDYLDSFDRTPEDCILTLIKVLAAVRQGKAQALLGNHELSYLENKVMGCSGYRKETAAMLPCLDISSLKSYIYSEGFLLTHAGVSQDLLDALGTSLEDYLEDKRYNQIGYERGGYDEAGGLYWCDWRYFKPIVNVPQIMGHSRGRDIRKTGNNYCIDCLEDTNPKGLLIENGVAEVYEFGQDL